MSDETRVQIRFKQGCLAHNFPLSTTVGDIREYVRKMCGTDYSLSYDYMIVEDEKTLKDLDYKPGRLFFARPVQKLQGDERKVQFNSMYELSRDRLECGESFLSRNKSYSCQTPQIRNLIQQKPEDQPFTFDDVLDFAFKQYGGVIVDEDVSKTNPDAYPSMIGYLTGEGYPTDKVREAVGLAHGRMELTVQYLDEHEREEARRKMFVRNRLLGDQANKEILIQTFGDEHSDRREEAEKAVREFIKAIGPLYEKPESNSHPMEPKPPPKKGLLDGLMDADRDNISLIERKTGADGVEILQIYNLFGRDFEQTLQYFQS